MHVKHMVVLVAVLTALSGSTRVADAQAQLPNGDGDIVTAGRIIDLRTEIAGDAAVAGAEVTISAPVNGYVMGAGRSVTVEGRVANDVWAAGETVTVDSSIGNNAMLAGRIVNLGRNTVIGHDARLAGNTVTAEGRVERNLDIGAGTAQIGADVGGSVNARADRVTILPGAVIRGDLHVRADQPPEISPQATVLGEVRYEELDGPRWAAWPMQWLFGFLALLVLGLAAAAFAPTWPARVADTLQGRMWASTVSGLIVLVAVPLAAGILAVTIIGIPLAVVMLAFYVATLLLGGVFVAYCVGDWLTARMHPQTSRWVRMLVGVLFVSLGMSLPIVGVAITAIVLIVGAGALVLERRSQRVLHPVA
jgi:hypothetical protein